MKYQKRIKGRDVALYVNAAESGGRYELAACSKSCDITITGDMVEISSLLSGRAKTFKAGRYTWSVGLEALAVDNSLAAAFLALALISGAKVMLRMTWGQMELTGEALVQSWNLSGSVGGMATYKMTFQGNGPLE